MSELGARVVVDVGTYRPFAEAAADFRPDILVLTHDDDDHIGSALDFFVRRNSITTVHSANRGSGEEYVSGQALEVWLPADWLRLVLVVSNVLSGIRSSPGIPPLPEGSHLSSDGSDDNLSGIDETDSQGLTIEEAVQNETQFGQLEGAPESLAIELPTDVVDGIRAFDKDGKEYQSLRSQVKSALRKDRAENREIKGRRKWVGSENQIATRVVKTSQRVADIILAAHESGAKFRFFDPDRALLLHHQATASEPFLPWQSQGVPGIATVINAAQVSASYQPKSSGPADVLALAHLSAQNRRSLVTFLWPGSGRGCPGYDDGVIIWSDSEHRILQQPPIEPVVPWLRVSVMSAPHHASAVQQHADIWRKRPEHVRVILSHNQERDSSEFARIHYRQRDCTTCADLFLPRGVRIHRWWGGEFTTYCSPRHA